MHLLSGKGSPRCLVSLALPTLYLKSEGRRVWYAELCTVTRTCLSNQNAFSALDVTKVERAKAGKTNCWR